MSEPTILVVGAGAPLGFEIVRELRAKEKHVLATFRTERPGLEEALKKTGAEPFNLDLADAEKTSSFLTRVDAAIFTPILSVAAPVAEQLKDNQRAIFFSSNNVTIDPDGPVYSELLRAEAKVKATAPSAIILRPTMIYGYPGDGNISRLLAFMKKSPVVFSPGRGAALQQPVYYKALAKVAADLVLARQNQSRIYAVAGPEPIPRQDVFRQIAAAAGVRPLIIPAPSSPLAALARLLERAGTSLPVSSAQLARIDADKTPSGADIILTDTSLEAGLEAMVGAMERALDDAPAGA